MSLTLVQSIQNFTTNDNQKTEQKGLVFSQSPSAGSAIYGRQKTSSSTCNKLFRNALFGKCRYFCGKSFCWTRDCGLAEEQSISLNYASIEMRHRQRFLEPFLFYISRISFFFYLSPSLSLFLFSFFFTLSYSLSHSFYFLISLYKAHKCRGSIKLRSMPNRIGATGVFWNCSVQEYLIYMLLAIHPLLLGCNAYMLMITSSLCLSNSLSSFLLVKHS